MNYTLNQWAELCRYTEDGRFEIDNNAIERQIRPIAVGRKNWLFAGSHAEADRAAVLYTLINTSKMHDVNPFDYFGDILRRVHPHPASKLEELAPLAWKDNFAKK